jgi:hypothetical protein
MFARNSQTQEHKGAYLWTAVHQHDAAQILQRRIKAPQLICVMKSERKRKQTGRMS